MDFKLGFIGTGNMGAAIIKGVIKSGIVAAERIFVNDVDKEKMGILKNETGINTLCSAEEVVEHSDIIILAVKPNGVKSVLEDCKGKFKSDKVLVSIAVGIPINFYKQIIGEDKKVVRTMPNITALVGEGMTLVSYDKYIEEDELQNVKSIFESIGKVEMLEEKLMSEVTALTGSSPAYIFMFIEAMADAAVLAGIPRGLAYKLAAQAVLGSAKMVLETGKHPGELKDQVCSPAGTTIEAVKILEKNGLRFAVMDAMEECTKRAREIGKIYG
ncbi:MAG: pyrroline-5-carboxylate reductase [Clostridia bacterium]|nr:pyrroline-5-carboxylate reductase [Clostridia bacterium]